MNKQTIIGFVLIGAILFGFSWYQSNQQKKNQEVRRVADSTALANAPVPVPDAREFDPASVGSDSLDAVVRLQADPLGETLAAARDAGQAQTFTVDNDVMTVEFSTLGGIVSGVELKDYNKYGGGPVRLWKPGTERFDVSLFLRREGRDAQLNTSQFDFTRSVIETPAGKVVSMRLPVEGGESYVEFVYTIPQADYMIDLDVRFVGMEGLMSNQSSFDVDWANTGLQNEKGFDNENNYTTLSYHYPDVSGIESLGIARAGGAKQESETGRIQWVAFKQQFFSSILIADDAFQGAEMDYKTHQPTAGVVKDFHANLSVPMSRDKTDYGFRMYFGPNKFSQLKEYGIAMERLVPLGGSIIGWISRLLVIPIFDWLGAHGLSFGWIILIMTFLIKLAISPLTFTSYKSSAKMRVIKPEVDEINARYPDQADAMKKQQATMELYRKAGINPLAGCIPMLIQLPFVLAMFRFFPAAIELRQQSLWWADDLSSYDSIVDLGFNVPFYGDHISLFALLTAVAIHFSTRISMSQQPSAPQMAGMKFMSLYLMPIMFLFWFNNYASGLNFYYLLSSVFSIAQIYATRMFLNEDKLRRKMLETPRKEKKKSGFMARLEEAQKAQLAAAKAQQQAGGGGNAASRGTGSAPRKGGAAPRQGGSQRAGSQSPGNRKKR